MLKVSAYVIQLYAGLLMLATAFIIGAIWYIQVSPVTKAVANINKPSSNLSTYQLLLHFRKIAAPGRYHGFKRAIQMLRTSIEFVLTSLPNLG